ncbi:MAG: type II toxin-antitoxin system RelE/ParE family toxin [Clostridia bacterium]|nr:type II toxin-antitoxin system RelE/ParE family toxin [Clostridia bacterium]
MKYTVIVSDTAKRQIASHVAFLANVSKEAAKNTKNTIIEALRSLETMPGRYPFLDEDLLPKNKYHKMFVESRYLILYQVRDNVVLVDYIVDCRQEYEWLKD